MAIGEEGEADPSGYAVGYRKPPLHTRFRKGQSGNPSGRPRRPPDRSLAVLLDQALDEPVAAPLGRGRRRPSKREAIVARLIEAALAADPRATRLLFELIERQRGQPPADAAPAEDAREVLHRRLQRLADDLARREREQAEVEAETDPRSTPQSDAGL